MQKILILLSATALAAQPSCTTPPVENVVVVQAAPRQNQLRTPGKVKTYTSGKYVDRADQLHGAHQVHRTVQSPRWDLSYTPRNTVSLSPGPVRMAAPVSANANSYRSRLAKLEQENQRQGKRLAKLVYQESTTSGSELDELRAELKDMRQEVVTLDKIAPEVQALKSKVASLEKQLSRKPAAEEDVWIPINEKSK